MVLARRVLRRVLTGYSEGYSEGYSQGTHRVLPRYLRVLLARRGFGTTTCTRCQSDRAQPFAPSRAHTDAWTHAQALARTYTRSPPLAHAGMHAQAPALTPSHAGARTHALTRTSTRTQALTRSHTCMDVRARALTQDQTQTLLGARRVTDALAHTAYSAHSHRLHGHTHICAQMVAAIHEAIGTAPPKPATPAAVPSDALPVTPSATPIDEADMGSPTPVGVGSGADDAVDAAPTLREGQGGHS